MFTYRKTPRRRIPGAITLFVAGLSITTLIAGCSHKPSGDSLEAGNQAKQNAQFAEAESDYQAAINAAPSDPRPHVALGQLYTVEKKPELARSEFMKALEIAPADAASHSALGDAYAEGSQPGLAEEQYRAAVALEPANVGYRMALGDTLAKAQKPGAAEAELRTATGLDPKNAHAHLALANLLGSEPGRQEEAQAEVAEVRALDPSLMPAAPATASSTAPAAAPIAAAAATAPPKLRVLNRKFLLTHDSPVYSTAGNTAPVVAQVHHGKLVHVTGMAGDWFRIQLKNGTVGFIPVTAAE
ncbi:MAG TPA: tetratricopeptide repeat protein [Candidatus Binataceae bacterium]|nr:tetratricopeptide repeat protein [Candidatus Binataceae bacterium]